MTLQQLSAVKRWHISHHRQHSVEYQLWDVLLAGWVMGLAGLAPAAVLAPLAGGAACMALVMAPGTYVRMRRRLHRHGRLRCDWLDSALRP